MVTGVLGVLERAVRRELLDLPATLMRLLTTNFYAPANLSEEEYILPPILLNSLEPLQIFTFQERGAFVPCWFVLPPNYKLHVTDGQHRIEGLRGAMAEAEYGKFQGDAVAVSIVEESSIEKTHQDFYDAAQVKPLPPAMLVEYDQREPLNRLTRELVREVPIFKDRTLRVGRSVGKKSPMMFTNNMVRRCVVMMVTGDDSKEALAATAIAPKQEMWRKRLSGLLKVFSQVNPQWRAVSDKPRDTGEVADVPGLREKYLHFTAAGLMVLGGVGHAIIKDCSTNQEELTAAQEEAVKRLATEVDWRRDAAIWQRSIVNPSGKITASRAFLPAAVAEVKQKIGLVLSEKEHALLRQAEEAALRHRK
jgi:DNA sulfur modification protein DndB